VYLGVDLGTSGVKPLLISVGKDILASASALLEVSRPPHNDAKMRKAVNCLEYGTDRTKEARAVPEDGDFGTSFAAAHIGVAAAGQAEPSGAKPPKNAKSIEPDLRLVPAFADVHARYRSTYRALKELS